MVGGESVLCDLPAVLRGGCTWDVPIVTDTGTFCMDEPPGLLCRNPGGELTGDAEVGRGLLDTSGGCGLSPRGEP